MRSRHLPWRRNTGLRRTNHPAECRSLLSRQGRAFEVVKHGSTGELCGSLANPQSRTLDPDEFGRGEAGADLFGSAFGGHFVAHQPQ